MSHIHIYFRPHQTEEALLLKAQIAKEFPELILGRFHQKPVGPHPVGSFLIRAKNEKDERNIIFYLNHKIGNLSAMIHPETGNDFEDHKQEKIQWIGPEFEIDRSIFPEYRQQTEKNVKQSSFFTKKMKAANLNYPQL